MASGWALQYGRKDVGWYVNNKYPYGQFLNKICLTYFWKKLGVGVCSQIHPKDA